MGHIHIIRDFYSYPEDLVRTLRIFTPDVYDWEPDRRFPVLYMLDGQNVFEHPESARWDTWRANTTLERLIREENLPPWIIVGVDHGAARFEEYTPWNDEGLRVRGRGGPFSDFLADHAKAYIDKTYRTLTRPESTAVIGASLGALMALYLHLSRPDTFGRVGALSASVMVGNDRLFQEWNRHLQKWSRIYLDAGENENVTWDGYVMDYPRAVPAFHHHLQKLGYADHELRFVLEPGGNHHEIDWQRRLPDIFRWLLS